ALRVDHGADAAGDAARVAFEVGDLVDDRRPVEDALVVRILLAERPGEARRLPRAAREEPRHVVRETVHVARLAAVPSLALEGPAARRGAEEAAALAGLVLSRSR